MKRKIAYAMVLMISFCLGGCGTEYDGKNNSPAQTVAGSLAAAIPSAGDSQEGTSEEQATASPDRQSVGQKGTDSEETEVEETEFEEAVSEQIALIASQVKKWTDMDSDSDDGEPYCSYAVTDLDRDGRLEVIESSADQGSGRFTTSKYFQVNEAGDALERISTSDDADGNSQDDIVSNMETVYYDLSTGEYHYITGDFATAGAATGFFDSVTSLTLRRGKISSKLLGYRLCEADKKGKLRTKYYQMTKKGKEKKLSRLEYDEEMLADHRYSRCAKSSVEVSWFSFQKKIEKYTQEELKKLLTDSYRKFSTGTAVKKVKKKILGYSVQMPLITKMQDREKQERLNRLIRNRVRKELKYFCGQKDMPFDLWGYYLTVKYAGRDEVSILGEIEGYAEGAPHPWRKAYTVNIDLEQEREIPQTEILPKKCRKEIERSILDGSCQDVSEFASSYRKAVKELHGKHTKKLWSDWKYVEVYRGKREGTVGVVINTVYALGSYAVYEVNGM